MISTLNPYKRSREEYRDSRHRLRPFLLFNTIQHNTNTNIAVQTDTFYKSSLQDSLYWSSACSSFTNILQVEAISVIPSFSCGRCPFEQLVNTRLYILNTILNVPISVFPYVSKVLKPCNEVPISRQKQPSQ